MNLHLVNLEYSSSVNSRKSSAKASLSLSKSTNIGIKPNHFLNLSRDSSGNSLKADWTKLTNSLDLLNQLSITKKKRKPQNLPLKYRLPNYIQRLARATSYPRGCQFVFDQCKQTANLLNERLQKSQRTGTVTYTAMHWTFSSRNFDQNCFQKK